MGPAPPLDARYFNGTLTFHNRLPFALKMTAHTSTSGTIQPPEEVHAADLAVASVHSSGEQTAEGSITFQLRGDTYRFINVLYAVGCVSVKRCDVAQGDVS